MLFEDALKELRQGKKITHPHFESDVYFQACRIGIMFDETPVSELPISIVKMKGEYQHPDMGNDVSLEHLPKDWDKPPCKHGNFPQLNLLLVMSDEWLIYD